ncbi:MAG: hypothetical protein NT066_08040 [Candidatus Omnitrophica bacterium]|nr:hypothetical protein [Candidatus Omnitrophota bacterium]
MAEEIGEIEEKPIRAYTKRNLGFSHHDRRYYRKYYHEVMRPDVKTNYWRKALNSFISQKTEERRKIILRWEKIRVSQAIIKTLMEKLNRAKKTKSWNKLIQVRLNSIKFNERMIAKDTIRIEELNKKIRKLGNRGVTVA